MSQAAKQIRVEFLLAAVKGRNRELPRPGAASQMFARDKMKDEPSWVDLADELEKIKTDQPFRADWFA